jgi:hypothetical protein
MAVANSLAYCNMATIIAMKNFYCTDHRLKRRRREIWRMRERVCVRERENERERNILFIVNARTKERDRGKER